MGGALLATVTVGCATIEQLAPPVDEALIGAATIEDDSIAMVRAGRHLYVTACARCHSPEAVTAYTRDRWRTILPRMAEQTGFSAEEQRAVSAYVSAVLTAHDRRPSSGGSDGGDTRGRSSPPPPPRPSR